MEVPCCCFLNLFWREVFSESGDGDGCRWIDLEGRKDFHALVFANFGVLVAIDSSNSEYSVVLIDPLIELGCEIF